MKKIKKEIILSLSSFILFFASLDALSAPASSEIVSFETTTKEILSLGKKIEREKELEMKDRLIERRERLTRISHIFLSNLDTRFYKKPSLDVSKRYTFAIQKYKLSCEIAALRMVLEAIQKTPYTEEQIFQGIPIYSAPLKSDRIWGDPDKEFVGYYTGSQRLGTGFGVYEAPLARFLKYEGISSRISNRFDGTNASPRDRMKEVLTTLSNSGHVILWGDWCTTPKYEDGLVESVDSYIVSRIPLASKNSCDRELDKRIFSWKTPEGKTIRALSGEHAFLLLGYIGTIDRPTHIIVFDTDTGRHIYPYSEWMRKWSLLDYRALIVES